MAKQDRKTLKNFFSEGQRPTGRQFEDLLDSMVHHDDKDFLRSNNSVMELTSPEDGREVISIFNKAGETSPAWVIGIKEKGHLYISGPGAEEKKSAAIVLKNDDEIELQARNIIMAGSRKGVHETVAADGKWHTVTETLGGISMVEITAAYTNGPNRCSTLIAWANHCFGRRRKIRRMRPRTFFWHNKIRLRWLKVKDEDGTTACVLQIKTRYNAGNNGAIKCSITQLWNRHDIE